MKNFYFLSLLIFGIFTYAQETSLNLKTLHQVNTYNGGEVFKTVFDDNQNNITVGYSNGEFSLGNENISTTNTNSLFVLKSDNQVGQKIWLKTIAPSSKGSIKPYLVYSKNNQTYIVFNFKGSVTLNNSTYNSIEKDWVIMKMDDNGNVLWSNSVEPMALKKYFDVSIQNGNAFFLINNKIFRFNDVTGELISSFYNSDFTLTSLETKDQSLYFAGSTYLGGIFGSENLAKGAAFVLKSDLDFNVKSSLQFYENSLSITSRNSIVDLEFLSDGTLSFVGISPKKIKAFGENGLVSDCNYNMDDDGNNLYAGRISAELTNLLWFAGNKIFQPIDFHNIKLYQLPNQNLHLYYSSTFSNSLGIKFFNTDYAVNLNTSFFLTYDENGQPSDSYNNFYGKINANFDFKSIDNKSFLSDVKDNELVVYERWQFSISNNFEKKVITKKGIISSNAFKAMPDGSFVNAVIIKDDVSNYFGKDLTNPIDNSYSQIFSKISANGSLEWSSGLTGVQIYNSYLYDINFNVSITNNGNLTAITECGITNNCYLYSNNTYELLPNSNGKTFITNFNSLGNVNWIKTYSGYLDSYSVYEHKGDSYVSFYTNKTFIFDNTTYFINDFDPTFVIIKISQNGDVKFVKQFHDKFFISMPIILSFDENDNIYAFIEAYLNNFSEYQFDNIIIPSNSQNQDYLMLKLDSNGTPIYGKNFYEDLPNDQSSGWLSDVKYNGSDFIVYGVFGKNSITNTYYGFDGQLHPTPADSSIANNFIAKVSKDGDVQWETPTFSNTYNYAKIGLDIASNIYIYGYWRDRIKIKDKDYITAPNKLFTSILKLDTNGDSKYVKETSSISSSDVNINDLTFTNLDISPLPNGKIVIAGNTASNSILNGDINNLNGDNYYIAVLEEEVLTTNEVDKNNTLKIYPNPTSDFINIVTKEKINNIEIYDSTGRKIISELNSNNRIDVRKLINGVYYIRVTTDKNNLTSKFIKK